MQMYISELIKKLEEIRTKHGEDVLIVVRHRDSGGDYYGYDSDLRLWYGEAGSKEDDYRDEVLVLNKEKGYWVVAIVPKIFIL